MNQEPNEPHQPPFVPANPTKNPLPPRAQAAPGAVPVNRDRLESMSQGVGLGAAIEALLKKPGSAVHEIGHGSRQGKLLLSLAVIAFTGLLLFGFIMGGFSGGTQYWAAPAKLLAGMIISCIICLPSLYIFCCLSGMDIRFASAAGLLGSVVGLCALLLAGFTPVVWVFGQSTESLFFMGMLLLGIWAISLGFGLGFLLRASRGLQATRPIHLRDWAFLFILVTLQMSCALRPLLGTADTFLPEKKKFFLEHWVQSAIVDASGASSSAEARTSARAE